MRAQSPLRGKAGLAVAYWLCGHPDKPLSPTGHSAELGFAPSTISTAAAALAEAGLVDEDRRAVLPELFWELATAWRPQWTWLARRPEPQDVPDADRGTAWALTGDRVASANGAPLVSAGNGPLELFVPDALSVTVAARRYGVAPPGAGAAAIAVAPVRQVLTGEDQLDGWRTAPRPCRRSQSSCRAPPMWQPRWRPAEAPLPPSTARQRGACMRGTPSDGGS